MLIEADKVADWAHNDRELLIKQTKLLIGADKVADWAHNDRKSSTEQTKLLIEVNKVADSAYNDRELLTEWMKSSTGQIKLLIKHTIIGSYWLSIKRSYH